MNFLAEPFAFLLRMFYSVTNNYAIALIFFTIIIKLLFVFINILQQNTAQGQARIRPKLNAIRKRYVGRTDSHVQIEFQNDVQNLYREERVSNSLGCLPLLIQLLIVMVLYQIIYNPLTYILQADAEYFETVKKMIVSNAQSLNITSDSLKETINKIVTDPNLTKEQMIAKLKLSELDYISVMNQNKNIFGAYASALPDFTIFNGAIDLSKKPTLAFEPLVLVPVLTVVFQLGSILIVQLFAPKPDKSTPEAQQTAKTMMITNVAMTLVSGYIAFTFPAIIGVYWIYQSIVGTIISVVLHKLMPIPSYTAEEMQAIEDEYNKDYVRPEITEPTSLHYIDEDDEEYEEDDGTEDEESDSEPEPDMPERRRYDKDGNKIHSLHFIDEDDEAEDEQAAEDTDSYAEAAPAEEAAVTPKTNDTNGEADAEEDTKNDT